MKVEAETSVSKEEPEAPKDISDAVIAEKDVSQSESQDDKPIDEGQEQATTVDSLQKESIEVKVEESEDS